MTPTPDTAPRGGVPTGPFARLGRWCGRRRRWVLSTWLVLFVVLGAFAPSLVDELTPGGFEIAGSQSDNVRTLLDERFEDRFPESVTLVVASDTLAPTDAEFRSVVDEAASNVAQVTPLVGGVTTSATDPTLVYPQSNTELIQVGLTEKLDDALRDVEKVIDAAEEAGTDQVSVGVTGGPAIFHDFNTINEKDIAVAEVIQLPLIIIVLLLFFGSAFAASVPIIATVVALFTTLGGLFFVASGMDLSIYVQNVVLLIGIGVGVDYSLFVANRFRTEVREGRSLLDAAAVTSATAGKAIFFSGLTVAVALGGMFAAGVPIFVGFAVGTIGVVILAVLVGLTLTPALLVMYGPRLFKADVRRLLQRVFRRTSRPPVEEVVGRGFWVRWSEMVMRRPWQFLISGTVVLLLLALPALDMKTGSSGLTALPTDAPSRVAAQQITDVAGPGAVSPILVMVSEADRTLRGDPAVAELARAIATDSEVAAVSPDVGYSTDGQVAQITVISVHGDDDESTQELVGRIGDVYAPGVTGLDGALVQVGGAPSQNRDFTDTIGDQLPIVVGLVMVLTFIVLVVLFRSLILPIKAVFMTLLSVFASYGVLVMVFQYGWGDSLLGFESLGHVSNWVPVFLFSILFGLSMDYEVFLLSRVREHKDHGHDDPASIAWGMARTGRIITTAALIMIIVFLSFFTIRLVPMKEMALGLAVAIFLDATLVRLMLVPAFMRIAGRWNWWLPAPLERILPRIED